MKITEELGREIRAMAGGGQSHRIIAEWCEKERGVKVSKQAVTKYLRSSPVEKRPKLPATQPRANTGPATAKTSPATPAATVVGTKPQPPTTRPAAKKGRPTLLTPELSESLVQDVAEGASFEIAAEANGISISSFTDWVARGRSGERPYSDFSAAVTGARARYKKQAIDRIRKGVLNSGERDWKAEMTVLERLYPDQFAPQQVINVKLAQEMEKLLDKLEKKLPPEVYDLVEAAIAESGDDDLSATG